ncbi:conserved hypothetical protein [Methanocaldococcus vulcanius M7]|uniref:Uncharacterized protein n=1 Tax=Methanocaldococcus vulcanius (strain ATCC 700851 / DSM 12094 / M7) TaxID=579137 RepID=C9RFM0_METVM|nr:hypothetical protein [Methanocaldococcus vulcanius]ACX72372.1 conserved hypothetical protein [Methanocaldococcus vulcanius M7]
MHIILKSTLLIASSILLIIFVANIYSDLINISEYKYVDKIDKKITSEILNTLILSNEGNITLFVKIPLNCKVLFENASFIIYYQNKTYIHRFDNNIIFKKRICSSEISKISAKKINNTYLVDVE